MVLFFFQAEDGIRGLVRSRGLGDVYKRQEPDDLSWGAFTASHPWVLDRAEITWLPQVGDLRAVSYTHLTLPTSDLV